MNGSQIPSWAGFLFGGKPRPGGPERNGPPAVGPPHIARRHFSRRQFLRTAASAAGVVLGSGWLLSPEALAARGDPRPLPGGTHLPFVPEVPIFHFYQPGPLNEVSTITDFNGLIAQARLIGTGTGTDTDTGEEKDLNFEADIRFMKGEYVDVDGRRRHGAFAFLWMDLFDGPLDFITFMGNIHSYDPGFALNETVWTTRIPPDSVEIDAEEGTARFALDDIDLNDSFNIPSAFRRGEHVPAMVSFDIRWSTPREQVRIRDPQVGFLADHMENGATIEWSVEQEGFTFVSDPAETSSTTDSKVGHERNGVFFR